uniref:Uncharacterized protein n=1 Tax=Aegilops tauschii subsp. strangulata TaxID=200361 RepID=A0A453AJZ3_AEGTS
MKIQEDARVLVKCKLHYCQKSESKCALVYGQMNEVRGCRARVDLTGFSVGEHFCDAKG